MQDDAKQWRRALKFKSFKKKVIVTPGTQERQAVMLIDQRVELY